MPHNNPQGWSAAFKTALLVFSWEIAIITIWKARWLLPVIKTAALRLLTGNS